MEYVFLLAIIFIILFVQFFELYIEHKQITRYHEEWKKQWEARQEELNAYDQQLKNTHKTNQVNIIEED